MTHRGRTTRLWAPFWSGLLLAGLLAPACHAPGADHGGQAAGDVGLVEARLVTLAGGEVKKVRVTVVEGARVVETRELEPKPIALPGPGEQTGGDAYFALRPGEYKVEAAALDDRGAALAACSVPTTSARVVAGQTVEVMLPIFCGDRGTGGLDALVTVETGPVVTNLTFDPSKVTRTCEPVTVRASATDRDGDALEHAWAVTKAPADARYRLDPAGETATFVAETVGSFELEVSVTDRDGHASTLAFPIHVGAGREGKCVRRLPTLDVRFAEVARRVPEFGGAFVGRDGALQIVLTDTRADVAAAAEAAVRDVLGADRRLPETARVVKGEFGFERLMANRVRARSVLGVAGVVSLDVDERKNRVKIGVDGEASRRLVERELARAGVERAVVSVETRKPIGVLQNTVKIRPVVGGTQIALSGGGTCTLGYVANRNGVRGYLTNSHCTNTRGGVEGTTHAQAGGTDTIGTETADPPFFTGGDCPDGRRCRWSDSSFAAMDAGVTNQRGEVYRTSGSRYRVVMELSYPLGGETLHKVGRTTGESSGEVSDTCSDSNVNKTNITVMCQDYVEATSDKGDSGSPVFTVVPSFWAPNDPNPVAAMGLLWGGPDDNSYFVFSAMWNIQRGDELGNVRVTYADAPPSISIVKPASGQKIGYGGFNVTQLEATTDDVEGGPDCCTVTWTSSVDGVLGTGKTLSYVFGGEGIRTITATAKDAAGNTKSDSVTVNTKNQAPYVTIVKPTNGQTLWKGLPYSVQGWAWDSESFSDVPCGSLAWTSSHAGDPFPAFGCAPQVTFLATGGRTLTLSATDAGGAKGTATVAFSVQTPPTNAPPIVSILKPSENAYLDADAFVTLVGTAHDTDNPAGTITYTWIVEDDATQKVIGTTSGPSGGQSTLQWKPSTHVPFNCGGGGAKIILKATDAEGESSDAVTIWVAYPVC